MQKIKREVLIERARQLIASGEVSSVLGWREGEFFYDVSPSFFESADDLQNFVWNDFCGANLSKFATKAEGRVLLFLKPCDCKSLNGLLCEHKIDRENVYIIAVPCEGMVDIKKLKRISDGVCGLSEKDGKFTVQTLFDGDIEVEKGDIISERCLTCSQNGFAIFDEALGEADKKPSADRLSEVKKIEAMSPHERFKFWQSELSRCIRCNACKNVCPACTCERCVFDNPESPLQNKAAADETEEKMFHIIRAFHVAGRCSDCGECSRACPENIPLHLLNRKLICDINENFGEFAPGETADAVSPMVTFSVDDKDIGGEG